MPNWIDLKPNQLVDRHALLNAIANNYHALNDGQNIPDGIRCVSVAEVSAWLKTDTASLPTTGRMPVKSDLVPLTATVRVKEDETYSPRIDINMFIGIDDEVIANPAITYDQTFTVPGGSVLSAVVESLEASTANNAQKCLRVSDDIGIVYQSHNPNLAENLVWSQRIAPGSNWLIEGFGSTGLPDFNITSQLTEGINWEIIDANNNQVSNTGTLAAGATINAGALLSSAPGTNPVFEFIVARSGTYIAVDNPGNNTTAADHITGDKIFALNTPAITMLANAGYTSRNISFSSTG